MMPTNMVQRKHLNERIQRKTQREPYFLIQIRNKNAWLLFLIPDM